MIVAIAIEKPVVREIFVKALTTPIYSLGADVIMKLPFATVNSESPNPRNRIPMNISSGFGTANPINRSPKNSIKSPMTV